MTPEEKTPFLEEDSELTGRRLESKQSRHVSNRRETILVCLIASNAVLLLVCIFLSLAVMHLVNADPCPFSHHTAQVDGISYPYCKFQSQRVHT